MQGDKDCAQRSIQLQEHGSKSLYSLCMLMLGEKAKPRKCKIKLKCKPTMISKGDNESWSTPRSCMIPLDSKGVTFYGLCSTPLGAVISLQLRLRVSKDLLNGHACTMPSRPPVCSIMHGLNFILLKREQCIIIQMNAYFQE